MIIGFGGRFKSGKDTAGEILVNEFNFVRYAFADNLKQMCMEVFNLISEQVYDEELKFKDFKKPIILNSEHINKIINWVEEVNDWSIHSEETHHLAQLLDDGNGRPADITFYNPRQLLQFVGSEILRDCIHTDFHALVLKNQIEKDKAEKAVITDMRFSNERWAVSGWGGKKVLVKRPTKENQKESSHKSETSLGDDSEYDFIITNDSTLESYRNKIIKLVKDLNFV